MRSSYFFKFFIFDFKISINLYMTLKSGIKHTKLLWNKKRSPPCLQVDIFRSTIFNYLSLFSPTQDYIILLHRLTNCIRTTDSCKWLIVCFYCIRILLLFSFHFHLKRPDDAIICQIFDKCHFYVNFTALPYIIRTRKYNIISYKRILLCRLANLYQNLNFTLNFNIGFINKY